MENAKVEPEELPLRGPLPKSEVRFNKKNVFVVLGVVVIVFSAITITGLIGKAERSNEVVSKLRAVSPGDFVRKSSK